MKFRKKSVVVEAFKFDGDLMGTDGDYYVPDWAVSAFYQGILFFDSRSPLDPPCELYVKTLEGKMRANVGDWIIQGVNGELYHCKPDIFDKTYEPAES